MSSLYEEFILKNLVVADAELYITVNNLHFKFMRWYTYHYNGSLPYNHYSFNNAIHKIFGRAYENRYYGIKFL